eukprot:jgi/Chrzof1/3571/Cz13g00230.t1
MSRHVTCQVGSGTINNGTDRNVSAADMADRSIICHVCTVGPKVSERHWRLVYGLQETPRIGSMGQVDAPVLLGHPPMGHPQVQMSTRPSPCSACLPVAAHCH